jgi:enoyl-CoA hydratase
MSTIKLERSEELAILTLNRPEALQLGIVNEVSENKALQLAMSRAAEIGKQGPLAVVQAKFAIDKGFDSDSHTGMDIEAKAYELLVPTEDRVEALKAFNEKRKPNFKGK